VDELQMSLVAQVTNSRSGAAGRHKASFRRRGVLAATALSGQLSKSQTVMINTSTTKTIDQT
jgi:hypothetical protein